MKSFKNQNLSTDNKLIKSNLKLLLIILITVSVGIFSCEGPVGPEGPPGPAGPSGAVGPAGADGNLMHAGDGEPESDLGDLGDFYLDLTTGDLYGPKDNQGWGTPVKLSGADGQDGKDGSQIHAGDGPPDVELGDEGDYYLDKENYHLYGPKTSEDWGDPIHLQGPEGEPGADGVPGWERVIETAAISSNGGRQSLLIDCTDGKNVLGGGALVSSNAIGFSTEGFIINVSGPVSNTRWQVDMTNNGTINATMVGYAICANTN